MPSHAERIASLETSFLEMKSELKTANEKLDELLALRNKGAGVFWFVSVIFTGGILGIGSLIIDWIKG